MTYDEKKAELTKLLKSVEGRIEQQNSALAASQARYGHRARRYGYGPSQALYREQERLRRELEGLDYEQAARVAAMGEA